MRSAICITLATLIWLASHTASSAAPAQMNYQGLLRNDSGQFVNDSLNLAFYIYPDAVGGVACWGPENHFDVPIAQGLFEVVLGDSTPIPDTCFTGARMWLEIWVQGAPLSPRKPILSAAYSIASSSVSAISSLDGVSNDGGDIDLVEGSNITIVPDDGANTITISSSGGSGGVYFVADAKKTVETSTTTVPTWEPTHTWTFTPGSAINLLLAVDISVENRSSDGLYYSNARIRIIGNDSEIIWTTNEFGNETNSYFSTQSTSDVTFRKYCYLGNFDNTNNRKVLHTGLMDESSYEISLEQRVTGGTGTVGDVTIRLHFLDGGMQVSDIPSP